MNLTDDWLFWVLGGLFLLGLLPLSGLLRKHRNQGILVLWCRRFSTPDLEVGKRNRWIWAVITEACRGEAIPVTLRDRSFVGSQSVGQSMQNPVALLMILAGIPLWLWGMLAVLELVVGSWPEFLVCAVGLAFYILMFRFLGSLTVALTTRAATFNGDPEKIELRLAKIRKNRWSRREMDVIRCTDENWQACVLAVLRSVDVVIIDNVDGSEHIDWEIQQSSEHVGKEQVFLLLDSGTEPPPGVTPLHFDMDRTRTEIEAIKTEWGDDDFGEPVPLSEAGLELASILRDRIGNTL